MLEGPTRFSTVPPTSNGDVQRRSGRWRVNNADDDTQGAIWVPGAAVDAMPPIDLNGTVNLNEVGRDPDVTAEIESLKAIIRTRLAPAQITFAIEHFAHQEDDDDSPIQLIDLVATAPPEVDDGLCASLSLDLLRRLAGSKSALVQRYLTVSVR